MGILPPPQYDLGEHPNAIVVHHSLEEVNDRCIGAGHRRNRRYIGCAVLVASNANDTDNLPVCIVFLPYPDKIGYYEELRWHEMGHCWGWAGITAASRKGRSRPRRLRPCRLQLLRAKQVLESHLTRSDRVAYFFESL